VLTALRLVWRRWRLAARQVRLVRGGLAFVAVLGPVWGAMFYVGGADFAEVIEVEIWKRIFGGENAPGGSSVPTLVWLLFYTLPGSVFALGALVLERPRRWLARGSATALPLWWIVAVVVPFSLSHGFRPDYLLPCYAAVAMLAAAGIYRLDSLGRRGGKLASCLRHIFATAPLIVAVFLIAASLGYLYHEHLPVRLAGTLHMPIRTPARTWYVLAFLSAAGLGLVAVVIRTSLRWRIGALAILSAVAMPGVFFIDRNMISRHARSRDGETMIAFARAARPRVGDDPFAVCRAEKLGTELYWKRIADTMLLGKREDESTDQWLKRRDAFLASLAEGRIKWLITCDLGLIRLGQYADDPEGNYVHEANNRNDRPTVVRTQPWELGRVVELGIDRPIVEDNMGRIYLIDLNSK